MKSPTLLLLLAFLLLPLTVHAQSGRNRNTKPPEDPKTQKSETTDTTVNESKINPNGETVEGDVIRTDTSLVMVPVSVLDRSGRYVPLLRREHFRISENGVEQKIAYFATTDSPFTVVLLIDTSGSTHFRLDDIQDAAINFVSKLKDNDSVMVMSFDDRIQVECKPTTDRDEIRRAIKHTRTGGGTRLYDAVEDILKKKLNVIPGRKAVVLFTDGVDTTSHRATYETTIRLAEESDAPIYAVDYDTSGTGSIYGGGGIPVPGGRGGIIFGSPFPLPGGTVGGVGDYKRAVRYLHALTETTGGRFYSGDSLFGIGQAFTWIAEELGRQYSLGYYPNTPGKEGERRQIKVKVTEPDLVVKSRDSYIYSEPKKGAKDTNWSAATQR
ncbi:MAG TPA: VWA domain-containing protein [Pyrinomonadaceae bacterium]|nr:VWA domain-containing protein [Pyrinomonadaceae bacterium]